MTYSCRSCHAPLGEAFLDLGYTPLANVYPRTIGPLQFYPLQVRVCEACWLVQLPAYTTAEETFGDDYPYATSINPGAVRHAREYAAAMVERFKFGPENVVIEIASNDGYLLDEFHKLGIHRVRGVEPARQLAEVADKERGIITHSRFFTREFARQAMPGAAHLLIANNVLAHVPSLNDFVAGMKVALAPAGTATVEVPWLLKLIEGVQFDTIYHEHFSYFSLNTLFRLFSRHGLTIYDVEELPTHGGSLRLYIGHGAQSEIPPCTVMMRSVAEIAEREINAGLLRKERYVRFAEQARVKMVMGQYLPVDKAAVFGCPAKLTTRLHATSSVAAFTYAVDDTPAKQGRYVPGTSIPIHPVAHLLVDPPDVVVNAVWNWREDVEARLKSIGYTGRLIHVE